MTGMIPFYRPAIGDEEIAEVVKSLASGWLTSGPQVKRFEQAFAAYLDVRDAVAVSSATAGLHLALDGLGIGPGDEVITTDLTFTATAEVIRYVGAEPVFCDIDPATLNISPAAIEAKITPRTKAIIVVHFAGYVCEMDAIIGLARRNGLAIVEDAAHTLPASSNGVRVGGFETDAAVFSFYANKPITTGEGGMVVARDPGLVARMRVSRLHGIDRDTFDRYGSSGPVWQYDVVAPGYKYNMTDIAAAIGIRQLAKVDDFHAERLRAARLYDRHLEGLPLIRAPRPAEARDHSWHLYIIQLTKESRIDRDQLIMALFRAGIACSVHYTPLHRLSFWRRTYGLSPEDFPNAEKVFQNCISLPLFVGIKEEEIAHVADAIRRLTI